MIGYRQDAICFRIKDTEVDLPYHISAHNIGNVAYRALAKLALELGHVDSYTRKYHFCTSTVINVRKTKQPVAGKMKKDQVHITQGI